MFILKALSFCLLLANLALALESRARQNFNCDGVLNHQIEKEFTAAQTYLSLASYFSHDRVALEGFAKMFEHNWKEEIGHGQKMIEYGLMRGANIQTPAVSKPDDSQWLSKDVCQILTQVLTLEKSVNEHLLKVHQCGDSDDDLKSADPQLQDFIEGNFLNEQIEANKQLSDLLTRLERTTLQSGTKKSTCDGLGLHLIDAELLKKYGK